MRPKPIKMSLVVIFIFFLLSAGTVSAAWSGTIQLTNSAEHSRWSNNAFDSNGNLHMAYNLRTDPMEVWYMKLDNSGNKLVSETQLTLSDGYWSRCPISVTDSSGNVHVVFCDLRIGNWEPYYVKLDNNGNPLTSEIRLGFSGQDTLPDSSPWPTLAVDSNDYVHVVWTDSPPDNTTIQQRDLYYAKLDNSGNVVVSAKRLTSTSSHTMSSAVTIDPSGNVHITWRDNLPGNYEIYYTKLDNSGNTLVSPKRMTTAAGDVLVHPWIVADSSGNIGIVWPDDRTGNGDIYYMKLDNNGNKLTGDILLASDSAVASSISDPFTSTPIDSEDNIHIAWAENRAGVGDQIYHMKIDIDGNILVSDTQLTSTSSDKGRGIHTALDPSGYPHITWSDDKGIGNDDVFYMRELSDAWRRPYDGGSNDYAQGVAVDGSGNAYVTGYSSLGGNYDYYTIKYDSSGNVLWTRTYDGGSNDYAQGVAVDGSNNVYITGRSTLGGNDDYYTRKYDSSGNVLWSRTYDGGSSDHARSVAVDGSGNVYITGFSTLGGDFDYYTRKYDSSGNVLWSRTYDGGSLDLALGVAVDGSGNVYVTGRSTLGGNWDYYTRKYDSSGNVLWSRTYDGGGDDEARGVAVDGSGNVYVTGRSTLGGNWDYYTRKYDSSGNVLWSRTYDAGNTDEGLAVATDGSGNVYVTGISYLDGSYDYYTIKYDSSGNELSTRAYDGSGGDDEGLGVAVDASNNVYVTGWSTLNGNTDYYTIKYPAVAPSNNAPALSGIPDKSTNEDVTPPNNFIDLYTYASDIEDTDAQLTFSIQSQSNSALISCTIVSDRYVDCGTPAANQYGYSDVTVRATDTGSLTDTDTFRMTVNSVNDAPTTPTTLTPTSGVYGVADPIVSITCSGSTDVDGDTIYYDILAYYDGSWNNLELNGDGIYDWDVSSIASQTGVDLACSANDLALSSPYLNPPGSLEIDNSPPVTYYNISLNSGWNLISIPLEQSNWSLTSVLAPIEGKYNVVFAYIGGGWKRSTAPRSPLTEMSLEYGYWINMSESATLTVSGLVPSVTTMNVNAGWNLMGHPSLTIQNLTIVLSPISYTVVFEYRNGGWKRSTAPRSPLTTMSPGYGYWINATGAGSYDVSN